MITGLDLLFLEVNSLEESVAFYQEVLGMEVLSVNNDSDPPMAKLRSGDLRITLAQHLETMLEKGTRSSPLSVWTMSMSFATGSPKKGLMCSRRLMRVGEVSFITLEDPDKYRYFFVTWTKETE